MALGGVGNASGATQLNASPHGNSPSFIILTKGGGAGSSAVVIIQNMYSHEQGMDVTFAGVPQETITVAYW